MKKRLLLLLLTIAVIAPFLFISSYADKEAEIIVDTEAFSGMMIKVGDEIAIPVVIRNNPGFASYILAAKWDERVFAACDTLYSVGDVVSGQFISGDSAVMFATKNTDKDGVLFYIHLKAVKACENSKIEITGADGASICDADENVIRADFVAGKVSVKGEAASEPAQTEKPTPTPTPTPIATPTPTSSPTDDPKAAETPSNAEQNSDTDGNGMQTAETPQSSKQNDDSEVSGTRSTGENVDGTEVQKTAEKNGKQKDTEKSAVDSSDRSDQSIKETSPNFVVPAVIAVVAVAAATCTVVIIKKGHKNSSDTHR